MTTLMSLWAYAGSSATRLRVAGGERHAQLGHLGEDLLRGLPLACRGPAHRPAGAVRRRVERLRVAGPSATYDAVDRARLWSDLPQKRAYTSYASSRRN